MNGPNGKAPASKTDVGAYAFSTVAPGSTKSDLGNDNKAKLKRSSINALRHFSLSLVETYRRSNTKFEYSPSFNPRRVLTHPAEGVSNSNFDNCNADYIIYVNDIIGSTPNHRYQVLDLLGQGTFGQVVKCRNIDTDEVTALKILKNKPAYLNQGLVEIRILELLNQHYDSENKHHITRLVDYFIFRRHLCLVFELLSVNLYELIKQNHFRGLSTNLIRVFMIQLLDALMVLTQANIIHCDMKPENILLQMLNSPSIKLIDFGSACFESQTVYSYIQSRHYRSPEVLIGTKYTAGIDMWSLGCIAAELFLGLPLFPGTSEYNQLGRIIEMQGYPPDYMLDSGKQTSKFFDQVPDAPPGSPHYVLKSEKQYAEESGVNIAPAKRYFNYTKLEDLIQNYTFKKNASSIEVEKERQARAMFCDFIGGLIKIDPKERWTPLQAKEHPFITGEAFTKPFVPNPALRKPPPLKTIPPRIPINPTSPFHPMSAPAAAFPPTHPVGSASAKKSLFKPGPVEYAASPESYSPRGFFTHMMQQQQGSNIALGASPSVSHFPPSPYSSYNPYHPHGPSMSIPASPSFSGWEGGPYPPPNYSHPHQASAPNNIPNNRRARSKSDSKDLPHMIPQHNDYRKRGDPSSVASTPVRGPVIGESPATSHFMFPGSLTSPRGEKGSSVSTTPSTPSGSLSRGRHDHLSREWGNSRARSRSFGNDNNHPQNNPPHPHFDGRSQPQSPRRPQPPQQQITSPDRMYSRSPSEDDPSNWDPNYSDEQLLYGYDSNSATNPPNATPPKRPSPHPPSQHQQHQIQHHQQLQQHQQQQYYQQQQQQYWGQPGGSMDKPGLYDNFSNLYIDPSRRQQSNTNNNNNTHHNSNNNGGSNITPNATGGSASVAGSWAQGSWTMPSNVPQEAYGSSYDPRDSSAILGFSPYVDGRMHGEQYSHSPPTASSATSSSFASYMQQQPKFGRSPPKQSPHKNPHHRSSHAQNPNPHKQQQQVSHSPPSKSTPIHHHSQQQQHHHHHQQQHRQSQQPHYSHQSLRTPPRPPNVIFSSPTTPHQQITTPVLPTAQTLFGSHTTPTHNISPFIDRASGLPKSPEQLSNNGDDVFTALFVADIDEAEEQHQQHPQPQPQHQHKHQQHKQPFGTTNPT